MTKPIAGGSGGATGVEVALPTARAARPTGRAALLENERLLATLLLAPTVILPSTRGIFLGWVKAYGSLCLWPCLFGIMERIADSLPWALFFGVIDTKTLNPIILADAVTQGVAMMFIGNLVFFFVYLAVPVAAWKLVNAVGQPFRGALG